MGFKSFKDKVSKLASEGAQKASELASEGSQKVSAMALAGTQKFGEVVERVKNEDIVFPEKMPDKKKLKKYDKEPDREFSNANEIFEYYAELFPGSLDLFPLC